MHMRITGLAVTNEDVDSRKAAIATLKTAWGKITGVTEILAKAGEVAAAIGGDGTPPPGLAAEVQTAVQKKASAFLSEERPLEVGIVAGLTASSMIGNAVSDDGWLIADVWATGLWLALSFQPALEDAKREALRTSLLDAAHRRCIDGAEAARKRKTVPDFSKLVLTAGAEAELTQTFVTATSGTIEALRRNAALDREELDFLWWTLLGRSRLLSRELSKLEEPVRVVAAGIEAAAYLRRLPCEVHREIILRTVEADDSLTLGELIAALGVNRPLLAAKYTAGLAIQVPNVFPLLSSLVTGQTVADEGGSISRPVSEWGARALLEAAMVRMRETGPGKL